MAPAGQLDFTWAGSTADPRAAQRPAPAPAADRLAACWYSPTGFTVDVAVPAGTARRVSVYLVDWDGLGRAERVEVLDPATGAVLDTRDAAGFDGGVYLTWQVAGPVRLRVTRTAGANAVLSGVFLDPPPAAGGAVVYGYDGLGRRVTAAAGGVTTDLYDSAGWQVLEERAGGGAAARYVWSPVYVDALVARDRDTNADGTPDERLWAAQDANGNVTALVDGGGAAVERYAYDPFGAATVYSPAWAPRAATVYAQAYLFQGRPLDSISGTYDFRRREYDPDLGRFTSLDPIGLGGGDPNPYAFVGNAPTSRVDPTGLDWRDWADRQQKAARGFVYDVVDNALEPVRIGGDAIRAGQYGAGTTLGFEMAEPEWRSRIARNAPPANAAPGQWDAYAVRVSEEFAVDSAIEVGTAGTLKGGGRVVRRLFARIDDVPAGAATSTAGRALGGGNRNSIPLTEDQIQELRKAAGQLGLGPDDIRFVRGAPSIYSDLEGKIWIGPNILPAPVGERIGGTVFERLTPRAAIAHEGGHLVTSRGRTAFAPGSVLDEVQASLVGRGLPGLSKLERYQLLRKAAEDAKEAGHPLRDLLPQFPGLR